MLCIFTANKGELEQLVTSVKREKDVWKRGSRSQEISEVHEEVSVVITHHNDLNRNLNRWRVSGISCTIKLIKRVWCLAHWYPDVQGCARLKTYQGVSDSIDNLFGQLLHCFLYMIHNKRKKQQINKEQQSSSGYEYVWLMLPGLFYAGA